MLIFSITKRLNSYKKISLCKNKVIQLKIIDQFDDEKRLQITKFGNLAKQHERYGIRMN